MTAITLNPTSGPINTKVTVTGTGFGYKWWNTITFDGIQVTRVQVSTTGTFTTSFNIPATATTGSHIIKSKTRYRTASATLIVTGITPPPPTNPVPIISNIVTTNIMQTSFTVSWHVSEVAQGWVEYGVSTTYGHETAHETSFNYADHSQQVIGLISNTLYHFRIYAVDFTGQQTVSVDQTITTTSIIVPPPPPPSTSYIPPPVTTQTIKLPTSIPNDGSIDVGPMIEAWVKTVGNGSRIEFPVGSFKFEKLRWEDRQNLEIRGQGSNTKLLLSGQGLSAGVPEAPFILRNCQHIAIHDFDVTGSNPDKTHIYVGGHENQFILSLNGWYGKPPSSYIEMSGITGRNIYTDVVYAEGENVGARRPSDHVWIHGCGTQADPISYVGRMGLLALINVTDLLMEDCWIDKVGLAPFDIEPNFAAEQIKRITFRRNHIGSYGHSNAFSNFFAVAAYIEDSPVEDIIIDNNDVEGIAMSGYPGDGPRGLNSKIIGRYTTSTGLRPKRITYTNNRTSRAVAGPALYFRGIDGVTCHGNVQPLLSGSIAQFDNCTNVVTT